MLKKRNSATIRILAFLAGAAMLVLVCCSKTGHGSGATSLVSQAEQILHQDR